MVFRYLNLINHEEQGPVLLRRDKIVCMLSLFGLPLLFFVCALSLFVRTPYLHMGSALQHHIFTWALLCTSTTPRFAPLVPCVLSLFGLTLLFFVYSLFLVCPCCSLCAFSFWFAPVVLWVLSLFGFPVLLFVCSLFFCLPLLFFVCALSLFVRTPYLHMGSALQHHIFTWALLCTSTTPRFAPLVPCVLSLFGLTLLFFVYSLFLVCPCCSLCAFSFWFAPVVLWVLSLFGFPLLFYVLSLFCLPLLFMCSLFLCTRHLFSFTPLCTSTIQRFSWDCT